MAGRLSNTQTVIGDCGHVCAEWPDEPGKYLCDICTRKQHGIGAEERLAVWVRPTASAAPSRARKRTPRKTVKEAYPLVYEGSLLDGQT